MANASSFDEVRDEKFPVKDSDTPVVSPYLHQKSTGHHRFPCYATDHAFSCTCIVFLCAIFASVCHAEHHERSQCHDDGHCRISLVESIPENLTYPVGSPLCPSTYEAWMRLIDSANKSIDIAAFYLTLRSSDIEFEDPSDWQGENVLQGLVSAARDRKIRLRVVIDVLNGPYNDTVDLINAGAEVRIVNLTELLLRSGVLHTKLWIVDGKHVYFGSANMDYRALTQVKELGAVLENCSCVAEDMAKIFDVYWYLGVPHTPLPPTWPPEYDTSFNNNTPMTVLLNATKSSVYISSAPPPLTPHGRTSDIDAILDAIETAEKFVDIAIKYYLPCSVYVADQQFWPVIDDALRKASLERGVRVRLLASVYDGMIPDMIYFLRSLADVTGAMKADIQVKLFVVPAFTPFQATIPHARLNHNKYMVTDSIAYIGTSNWTEDYFYANAGVGLVINQTEANCSSGDSFSRRHVNGVTPLPCATSQETVQSQLAAIFDRDWNSVYAHPLPNDI